MEVLACDIYILADFFLRTSGMVSEICILHYCIIAFEKVVFKKRPQRDTWTRFLDEISESLLNDTKEYLERFS